MQVLHLEVFFLAWRVVSFFGAVVVNVVMDIAVLAMLFFGLRGNAAAAGRAAHHAGKGKESFLSGFVRPRLTGPAHDLLNLVEFIFGDHRFMRSLMPITTME